MRRDRLVGRGVAAAPIARAAAGALWSGDTGKAKDPPSGGGQAGGAPPVATGRLRLRALDGEGKPVPAMACVTSLADDTARVPPDGTRPAAITHVADFVRGVEL